MLYFVEDGRLLKARLRTESQIESTLYEAGVPGRMCRFPWLKRVRWRESWGDQAYAHSDVDYTRVGMRTSN